MTDPQNPPYAPTNGAAPARPGPQQPFNYAGAPQPERSQQSPAQPGFAPAGQRPSIWAAFGPGRNILGVVSLCAATLALILSVLFGLVTVFVLSANFGLYPLVTGIGSVLSLLLMLAAVGFGIAGLLGRSPSKWPAIAGTAIGVYSLISMIFGAISSAMYSIF